MFRPVTSKINFPLLEEKILEMWKQNRVFERSVEARRGCRRFTLYEGPPTANGSPGIHHVLARVFKDVIPRHRAMKGYYAPRIAGWDTHGLPVELEVEKELGLSSKKDIEDFGVDRFNARCRQSVFKYLKEWEAITERVAFWVDLGNAYVTMRNEYIETVWWAIKQMWDRGLIYQGYRVTPHCPRCGTSLSSHEVALGYEDDIPDPSVYIKFKFVKSVYFRQGFLQRLRGSRGDRKADFAKWLIDLVGDKNVYLLAWTTTPWTLPGNTALAVAAEAEYSILEVDNEYLILASARLEQTGLSNATIVAEVKGSDLLALMYEPLFNPADFNVPVTSMQFSNVRRDTEPKTRIISFPEGFERRYPVIATDFVSMEDGTGIVHIAPAYGEVDYEAYLSNKLDFVHNVDLQGKVTGTLPGAGKFVKDADKDILVDLESRGLLYRSETIRHTYPFCWRCGTPLLYYAKQTWYIRTTAVKKDLIAGNGEINWYPEHIKYGRFGDWLENNVDWAFSRERYWGTPLPVWCCQSCGQYDCVGSLAELENKAGVSGFNAPLDLHRPYVDELNFDCHRCGGKMSRVPEVIDCWFDSGAMPVAQYHYPFDNSTIREDGRFPADYICEAVDQTRGWFYSLHAISTLLFSRPSFKNVICLGHILDAKGGKMSKARGNVVEPWAMINKFGADALRWYFFTSSPPGNVRRFSGDAVAEIVRRFFLTLWNVYSFFVTYANIDRFAPGMETKFESELDRWITSELNQLMVDVDKALEDYNPTEAGRKIEAFVNALSNWYVRRSRRRFWKSGSDADKISAYSALYECLVTLSKLLAPLAPFLAEEMYRNLVCSIYPKAPDSVHLANFPVADETRINRQLSDNIRLAMKVCSMGRAARAFAGVKVRQPLSEAVINGVTLEEQAALSRLQEQIKEELNVKELSFDEIREEVKPLDVELTSTETVGIKVGWTGSPPADTKNHGLVVVWEAGYRVAVQKQITDSLEREGMAREIIRRIQTMRRAAGFDIADYITTYYHGDDYIRRIMEDKDLAGYIRQETLSRQLTYRVPGTGVYKENYRLSGYEIVLGVQRETA